MSIPESRLPQELELGVEAELELVAGSLDETDLPITEWQFDPADAVREETGLRNLLGAVEAFEENAGERSTA